MHNAARAPFRTALCTAFRSAFRHGWAVAALCVGPLAAPVQATQTRATHPVYHGTLETTLVEVGLDVRKFVLAGPRDQRRLPLALPAGARAYVGSFVVTDQTDRDHPVTQRLPALFVTEPGHPAVLYVGLRRDAEDTTVTSFTAAHAHVLQPSKAPGALVGDMETTITWPLPGTVFRQYTLRVLDSPRRPNTYATITGDTGSDTHYLWVSQRKAQGHVVLDGRPTVAQFEVSPLTGKIPSLGTYSLDCTGDSIDPTSHTENQYKFAPEVVVMFKVGDTYVAPDHVDERLGTFTMIGHRPDEYIPPLDTGVLLSNVTFTTFDGTSRHLSDYRGKYVLLDFWTIQCGPCIESIPTLAAAYATYHPRGFEIIGINLDDNLRVDKVDAFLKSRGSTWVHTSLSVPPTGAALGAYVDTHCRIHSYPTLVLLGPDGKIVALSEALFGPLLQAKLAELLPK